MSIQRRLGALVGIGLALIAISLSSAALLRADSRQIPMQSHDFTDVPVAGKEFMEPYINAFYHQGVTGGCSASPLMYCPEATVSRAEIAVFMGRALGYVEAANAGHNTEAYFKNTSATGGYPVGVFGDSTYGSGVVGWGTIGVQAIGSEGDGLYAKSTNSYGVSALSVNGSGLYAQSEFTGGDSLTDSQYDIHLGGFIGEILGTNISFLSNDNFYIRLDGDNNETSSSFQILEGAYEVFYINGSTSTARIWATTDIFGDHIVHGSKSAIVDTVHYGSRKLYSVESTEIWFEDFGFAELVDGEVTITFDPVFAETVNLDQPYHVFLTPLDESAVLYVTDRTATSFTVRADHAPDIAFSYRIVAKRLGYEDVRLEEVTD